MNFTQRLLAFFYNKDRHSIEIISMLFTLFYFFPFYFYEHLTAAWIFKALLLYFFLLAILLGCAVLHERKKMLACVLLIVFSTMGAKFHMGTNVFYAFAVFYFAFHLPLFRALVALSFTVACIFFAAFNFDLMKPYFLLPTFIPSLVLFISGVFERLDRQYKRKEEMTQEQLERLAAVAERERIARDLHDVLGHTLSSIALKSQLAEKLINAENVAGAKKEIKEVAEITSTALFDVRRAISGYKSLTIDERVAQLRERLRDKGLQVSMECDFTPLKAKAEAAVALLLTEAVTNILRHSAATHVRIYTEVVENNFKLGVCDNGLVNKLTMGNGLQGIKERVEQLHGNFELNFHQGVCLYVTLPKENLQ